jgi:hypothetical protein
VKVFVAVRCDGEVYRKLIGSSQKLCRLLQSLLLGLKKLTPNFKSSGPETGVPNGAIRDT